MSEYKFNSFINYKQTVIDLTGDLKKIREFSERMKLEGNVSAVDDVLRRLAEDTFSVAIVGEFKRGKSTLINALLEKDILPTDVIPTTATLNKVTYSVTPFVRIEYNDGRVEDIDIDKLNDYVTKLTPESEKIAQTVKIATVYYPVNYCKNGVTIIDTPGLNDDEAMTNVTLGVLPQIDAAIMVMMAGSPFSQYECDFLENKVITSDLGRVLFVVTGIDLYDEDDAQKILSVIRKRIMDSVLMKAKRTYGEGTKEYEAYQRKLGNIQVYGLSAKKALKAKQKNDQAMLEKSRFPEFETALERFLTEDRGAVMLNVPVSRIKTSTIEIAKAVQLRESALSMEENKFSEKYSMAMEEIEQIRNERQKEFSHINEAAEKTYSKVMDILKDFWSELQKEAEKTIAGYYISQDALKGEAAKETQEAMAKAVQSAISRKSQEISEHIQETINQSLENEADRVSGFEQKFYEATEQIQNLFVNVSAVSDNNSSMAISTTLNYFTLGIGSAYDGYREAGWKGALIGGLSGGAGTFASSFGAGLLITLLGIPLTWPVMLVVGVGSALAGTFTGKWAIGKMFSENKIEKFRNAFREAVLQELQKMKAEDNFSQNVRAQIESAFDALKKKIKTETENILSDMQSQLTQIKVERAQADSISEREKDELRHMLSELDTICARAERISKELTIVLSKREVEGWSE